jgi:hypothetical protein
MGTESGTVENGFFTFRITDLGTDALRDKE